MDITTAQKVVLGETPDSAKAAYRWMDAALAWYGVTFTGDDANGEPRTVVTSFHWDTRGDEIQTTRRRRLSRRQIATYDRNAEAAFTIIDQNWNAPGGAYAAAQDVQPCADCGRLITWFDSCGWVHVDYTAPECFLHGSYSS